MTGDLADLDVALDGAALLDELREAFTRYVVFPSPEAADATTLWTAATHAQPAWEHATRLDATSPEKRCGKSRLLDVIEATSYQPLITVNISAAALAHSVGDDPPTLLLDEADTIFGKGIKGDEKAETLRGLLNAGHQRNRPYIRWDPNRRQPERCPTFAMAALAGIGGLPDTIADRAVIIRMRRRAPGENVAAFRIRRDTPPLHDLRDRITAWARAHQDALRDAVPDDMPVDDRAYDNWTPLVAIADLAGGEWPKRARNAAELLTAEADESATALSLSLRLLADLAEVFGEPHDVTCPEDCGEHITKLPTSIVLGKLRDLEEAPWGDYFGKPLDSRGLAKLLRRYEVGSKVIRVGDSTPRGYDRADLHDAWTRYLPGIRNKCNERNIAGQGVAERSGVADASATPQQPQLADQERCTVADVADTWPTAPCRRHAGTGFGPHPQCLDCQEAKAGDTPIVRAADHHKQPIPAPKQRLAEAGQDGPLVTLAERNPSAADPRPPCQHEACWDALAGRCLAGENSAGPAR